jgi:hypothetical protein
VACDPMPSNCMLSAFSSRRAATLSRCIRISPDLSQISPHVSAGSGAVRVWLSASIFTMRSLCVSRTNFPMPQPV